MENMSAVVWTVCEKKKRNIRGELGSPGCKGRKTVEQNMKALKSTLSIHITLRD